jgi:hypothetical protein
MFLTAIIMPVNLQILMILGSLCDDDQKYPPWT